MKLNKLIIASGIFLTVASATMGTAAPSWAASDSSEGTVINERWGKPTFVMGAALNSTQKAETMEKLGVDLDSVNVDVATGDDLVKFLGYGSGDDSVMFSSVVVNREDKGKGIHVDIVTPENITLITADQYKNPLITAGITDATIKVASVVKVTGESALTGVYKAFEANGEKVDTDRAKLAQDELDTTTSIADSIVQKANQENQDADLTKTEQDKADEAYKAQLNQTLVDIKKELAELKEKQAELATKEDVEKIVNDALAKNNLADYISKDDVQKLVSLAEKYQTTNGVLDKEAIDQLDQISEGFKNTVDDLSKELGSFGEKLKGTLEENQGFFASLWQSIKDFFSNLFG